MWFRLKNDYKTSKGEIHFDHWNIEKIKKGAAIVVGLIFCNDGKIRPDFIFSAGGLKHMDMSMLDTPNFCVKNFYGDVYCARKKKFFYGSFTSSGVAIARQMIHCPLCGKRLVELVEYPREEKSEKFEGKMSPAFAV